MKISNNALNFLLAQYRAIFKRAYIKGLASAVILTAGLAAGQAQATPTETDPIWATSDDSSWNVTSGDTALSDASGTRVAGDYDDGKTEDHDDGSVSGETLIIGSGTGIPADVNTVSSGGAYAGYVKLGTDSTLDAAVAEDNKLTVTSGAKITTTGNIVGGWAKNQGTGTALAKDNALEINNLESISSGGQFIGGMAGSYHGATAKGNSVKITGVSGESKLTLNNTGTIGAIVFVGDGDSGALSGVYRAEGNTVEASNIVTSGGSKDNNTFVGGQVAVLNLNDDHNIELMQAQGNSVKLSDFSIGNESDASYSGGLIVGNKVTFGDQVSGSVASMVAYGSADTGVTLKDGEIYGAFVYGGWAENQSGGSATANANNVNITDTQMKAGGNGAQANWVIGGVAQTAIGGGEEASLSASQNTVRFENSATGEKDPAMTVNGNIRGAYLTLRSGGAANAVGSTFTADGNSINIGANINLAEGSIQGAYIELTDLDSGGATVHASNNTITLDGNWTASDADRVIIGVQTDSGVVTAQGNRVVINGKVTGQDGTNIMGVKVGEQDEIKGSVEDFHHDLSNNTVEIGAKAEVIDATIAAAYSSGNNAQTLNDDVIIAGKVTNSDIYGGTGKDSVIDVQAGSRLTYSDSTGSDRYLRSDNVNLAGIVDVGAKDKLHIMGFATDGNNESTTYNTNQTSIASTAELYNRGSVELLGATTVAAGAKLHALADGATIKVNGDVSGSTIEDDAAESTLKNELVGGRGQLTITQEQLKSYLTAGHEYTYRRSHLRRRP